MSTIVREIDEAVDRPRQYQSLMTLAALCLTLTGCVDRTATGEHTPTVSIDFSKRMEPGVNSSPSSAQPVFHIAVAGMTSPAAALGSYQDLLGYIGRGLQLPVRMTQRKTYQEVNDLLVNGELDAAFLCSGGYVAADGNEPLEIIGVPVVRGKTTYQAYIIVHQDSDVRDFLGLRQHSFAFTDPLSNTGWLYPVFKLEELGMKPSSFFSQVTYTYAHDRSIEAVALKFKDGASVDSLVYEHLAETKPDTVQNLRIIERSPLFGMPPVVASPQMRHDLRERFRSVLLSIHEDTEGARILRTLFIDRFVAGDGRAYESIRRMARRVGPWRP